MAGASSMPFLPAPVARYALSQPGALPSIGSQSGVTGRKQAVWSASSAPAKRGHQPRGPGGQLPPRPLAGPDVPAHSLLGRAHPRQAARPGVERHARAGPVVAQGAARRPQPQYLALERLDRNGHAQPTLGVAAPRAGCDHDRVARNLPVVQLHALDRTAARLKRGDAGAPHGRAKRLRGTAQRLGEEAAVERGVAEQPQAAHHVPGQPRLAAQQLGGVRPLRREAVGGLEQRPRLLKPGELLVVERRVDGADSPGVKVDA